MKYHFAQTQNQNMDGEKKGKRLLKRVLPRSKSVSIIAAICDVGVLGCQVLKGGVKKEDFLVFVYNLAKCYEFQTCRKKIVLFMDNAPVHQAKLIKTSLEPKITLLYNAGYSPMLNPIEEFFSKFKALMKRLPTSNDVELLNSIQRTFRSFNQKDFRGYIRHMLSFIPDALNFIDLV